MVVGLVCSTFDCLHAGHVLMLEDAYTRCEHLIVGLQTDASKTPKSYRGKLKPKPIMSLKERKIMLNGIKYVDKVFTYTSEGELLKEIKKLPPHIRILGSDWEGKHATGQELAEEVYYHKRNHDYSTTNLKNRIKCEK